MENKSYLKYEPYDKNGIKLNVALISDLHAHPSAFHSRNRQIKKTGDAICDCGVRFDALVAPGDLTNDGEMKHYRNLDRSIRRCAMRSQFLPQMGNHDARGPSKSTDFAEASRLFQKFCSVYGIKTEDNHYYKVINGYYFIVLGTDKMLQDQAYISERQLKWLDSTLELSEKAGKPSFIICHQPLNTTNGVEQIWNKGLLGEQSDRVLEIIRKYTDKGHTVIYISGHLHAEYSNFSMEKYGILYCFNLPSVQFTQDGGLGATVEAYDDRVIIRPRDFDRGIFIRGYEYEIPLKK